ncbi:MAG: DUF5682 family protein [Candidatus Hermodarchaeota archaeon]
MSDTYLNAANLKKILFEIGTSLGIDNSTIDTKVSKVKNSEVKYLPVRHHSPGSTILVKKWIEKYEPKLILVEGPVLADDLIQYLIDKKTIPPIAILSLYADINNKFGLNGILSPHSSVPAKFEAYYPFVSYSPELVALTEATKRKIPIHFIDLPLTGLISFQAANMKNPVKGPELFQTEGDSIYAVSAFYKKFAQVFDFEDFSETWETLFEIGANKSDIDELRESMLLFCGYLRQTTDDKILEANGTFAREAYMKHNIEHYIKQYKVKEKEVLVITGGIHSVALLDTVPQDYKYPTKQLINSLVPFSYYRISQKSGYMAGNQAPQFYDMIWRKFTSKLEHPYEAVALDFITDIFKEARAKGNIISISDSINSFQGAKMLAMLRRREEPDLKDIIDSIYMVLIKGNPEVEGQYLESLIQDKSIGYKVGKITPNIGKLPLQQDFYLQLETHGIKTEEKKQSRDLNLREEADSKVSQLLWKIKFLGIDFANRLQGPDVLRGITGTFTEKWSLKWHPNIDVKLVELSTYGSTLDEASKNLLVEETKKNLDNFSAISNLLYQSLSMGYNDQFEDLYDECLNSLEKDNQFLSLAEGFSNMILIFQLMSMMESQKTNLELMEKLVQRSYYTCCFSIPNFANPPEADEVIYIDTMKMLANTLISVQNIEIDLTVYTESINTCNENSVNEFIKGGTIGILYLLNYVTVSEIKTIIFDYLNSSDSIKVKIGDFVHGLIYVCQIKILINQDIVNVLAEVVGSVSWDVFSAILPAMRKSFSELHQTEYNIFVEKLAEHYGLIEKKHVELKEIVEEEIKDFFKSVDDKLRKIFEEWFGKV